jgi:hypothetical protein
MRKILLTGAAPTAHQNQYQGPHKLSHQALEQPDKEGQTGVLSFFLHTVKKGSRVSRHQPGCHYQTLPGRE